jgi:hypothetical protein
MAYFEKRTGKFVGEVTLTTNGAKVRYRRRFDTKKEAEGYEAYVRASLCQ